MNIFLSFDTWSSDQHYRFHYAVVVTRNELRLKKLLWKHSNIMSVSVRMYGSSTFVIVIVSISSVWIIVIVIVFINEIWSRLRRNNNPRRHHRSSRSRVHFKLHITNQLQHRMTDRRPLTAAIVCQIGESADWDGQG